MEMPMDMPMPGAGGDSANPMAPLIMLATQLLGRPPRSADELQMVITMLMSMGGSLTPGNAGGGQSGPSMPGMAPGMMEG